MRRSGPPPTRRPLRCGKPAPVRFLRRLALTALLLVGLPVAGACNDDPAAPRLPEGDLRVLFVGNSLTYTNDLPGMVATLARAEGVDFQYTVRASPNFALGDHWNEGLEGIITELAPDVVVLQQGPSSLPSSRAYLLEWTARIGEVVTGSGGRPALFMVWPDASRAHAFDAVRDNYADAAARVDGIFLPAGETWRAAWSREPGLALYGPDAFHPSTTGSAAAAVTIWAMLSGSPGEPLPCSAERLVEATRAELLCEAMREAVETHGVW